MVAVRVTGSRVRRPVAKAVAADLPLSAVIRRAMVRMRTAPLALTAPGIVGKVA